MKKYTTKGFTLVETILSLLVVSFSITILCAFLKVCTIDINRLTYKEEESAIMQMQKLYVLGCNHDVEFDMWNFMLYGEEMYFYFEDSLLVLAPGYQVFSRDVEEVRFMEEGDCLYITYENKLGVSKKRILGCE